MSETSNKPGACRGLADASYENAIPTPSLPDISSQQIQGDDNWVLPNPHDPRPNGLGEFEEQPLQLTPKSSSIIQKPEAPLPRTRNVVIFGESGSGKSSIINAIAPQVLSETSSDAAGCTFQSQRYDVEISGQTYALFDTAGLDEATAGTVPPVVSEDNLKKLLHELMSPESGGIGLLVYCVRGTRVRRALARNYNIFYSAICRKKVPIVIVVTGLENHTPAMKSWWETNEKEFQKNGMHFKDHACVTTLRRGPAIPEAFTPRITDSIEILRNLITKNYSEWVVDVSWVKLTLAGVRHMISDKRSEISSPPTLIICDPSQRDTEIADCISGTLKTCVMCVDKVEYQVRHVPEPQESDSTSLSSPEGRPEADLLIYYAYADEKAARKKFKTFCAAYCGNIVPVIVVVKGLNSREMADQWVKDNIAENGAGNLISTFAPARGQNNNSAREKAGQELRELILRYHLDRSGGRNKRGVIDRMKFWSRLRFHDSSHVVLPNE